VGKCFRVGQATDGNMAHARWMLKATNTIMEHVILVALPMQQF